MRSTKSSSISAFASPAWTAARGRPRVVAHRADVYWASPGFGLALAQAYNDAAAAAHVAYPNRFVGLAMLPMQAPDLALKELERAAKLPGMRGMYLATHVNNVDLDDRRFWDIYAQGGRIGLTIFLHPSTPSARADGALLPQEPARQSLRYRRSGGFTDLWRRARCISQTRDQLAHAGGTFLG